MRDREYHQMIINVNGKTDVNNHDAPNFRETNVIFNFLKKQLLIKFDLI